MDDTAWTGGPLLGFDTETTGVDVHTDRIVTAAVVLRTATTTDVRTWMIDPGVEIPAEAAAIHGVTTEHARAHGVPPRQALAEIAAVLAEHTRAGVPVVAYNAAFVLTLLDAELVRHGLATLPERLGRPVSPVLDPLVIDRWQDRYRRGKRRLGDLVELYGITGEGDLHSADVDVLATLDVRVAQQPHNPELRGVALLARHSGPQDAPRRWATSFNEWRRTKGLDGPGASTAWPVEPPAAG